MIDGWTITQPLTPLDRGIVGLAGRLTLLPNQMAARQLEVLEGLGMDQRAVYDVVLISACFAFMNRLADGTGVTLLPDRYALAVELFGQEALARHLRWGAGQAL